MMEKTTDRFVMQCAECRSREPLRPMRTENNTTAMVCRDCYRFHRGEDSVFWLMGRSDDAARKVAAA